MQQGGVKLEGNTIGEIDATVSVSQPSVLKVGKRRFVRLLPRQEDL